MKQKLYRSIILWMMVTAMLLTGCSSQVVPEEQATNVPVSSTQQQTKPNVPAVTKTPQQEVDSTAAASQKLDVHFIDVGQADCILLVAGKDTMLIDAGNNKDGDAVVSYLKEQGIQTLNYVVGTHPDADHIGGLDVVIDSFEVKHVWMPKKSHTTKTFEDVLLAVQKKGLKITSPKVGTQISLGDASITVYGPHQSYQDNNNNSIVLKVAHGENSFLMTGDAELEAEQDELESGMDLHATVLKVGHHGAHTSTSKRFLEAVDPTYAVISCGIDNSYGHPHKETLNYLKDAGVTVYRTDQSQTIRMQSDGKKLSISVNNPSAIGNDGGDKNSSQLSIQQTEAQKPLGLSESGSYIGNKNSKKFHLPSCSSLPEEKNRVYFSSRQEAVNASYDPCGRCNP